MLRTKIVKACNKCRLQVFSEEEVENNFHKNGNYVDDHSLTCKVCTAAAVDRYKKLKEEKIREDERVKIKKERNYQRGYFKKNREKILKQRKKHKEEVKQQNEI